MDKQKIFDQVVAHARKQGRKAYKRDGDISGCLYRAPNGDKCFIGCLIPDAVYDPSIEQHTITDIALREVQKHLECTSGIDENFLSDLQTIHDDSDVDQWEEEFETFAEDNGLVYTPKEVV